jgi:hypothetical protein
MQRKGESEPRRSPQPIGLRDTEFRDQIIDLNEIRDGETQRYERSNDNSDLNVTHSPVSSLPTPTLRLFFRFSLDNGMSGSILLDEKGGCSARR